MPAHGGSVRPLNLWVGPTDPRLPWTAQALTANTARGAAFTVERPVTVSTVRFSVSTQNGNLCIALYTDAASCARIATTGSFACPATGVQTQALSASVTLVPGIRYWAVVEASGTAALHFVNPGVSSTLVTAALLDGSTDLTSGPTFPLPDPLTRPSGTQSIGSPVVTFS